MRPTHRQSFLAHLGRELAGETRLERFLDIATQEVRSLLKAHYCRIYLDGKGRRYVGASKPLPKDLAERVRRGVRAGTAVRLEGGKGAVRCLLAAPMNDHDGRLLGYIEVANRDTGVFDADDEGFLLLLASITGHAIETARLHREVQNSHLETIYRLATVAEFSDPVDLTGHLRRMSRYSALIAEGFGLDRDESRDLLYASPLHDIGKVAIPDAVLHKPAKLTPDEYDVIKQHTTIGARILSGAKDRLLRIARTVALYHHEKYDGSGYPEGLKGLKIPVEARIVAVADVFDALCSRRVYKPAWEVTEARDYIVERTGKDFDPKVVAAFEKAWPKVRHMMSQEWFLQGRRGKGDAPGLDRPHFR